MAGCKVKPYATRGRVEPISGPLSLSDIAKKDLGLFDTAAQETTSIAGTQIDLYHLNLVTSTVDPLYDEPIERDFDGPYRFKGYLEYPEPIPSTGEEGFRNEWPSTAWVSRKELEEADVPTPAEGDIIRVWDTPFFRDFKVPGSGFYFDVINVNNDVHVHDTPNFVGFKLFLKRRTEFAPERKIFPPTE